MSSLDYKNSINLIYTILKPIKNTSQSFDFGSPRTYVWKRNEPG